MSACGRRNEAPRRTREKASGTQGTGLLARTRHFIPLKRKKRANHIPPTYKRNFNFCPRKYEDAAETAFAQKSEEGLDLVLGKCATSNRPLVNRIQEMKAQLRQRR